MRKAKTWTAALAAMVAVPVVAVTVTALTSEAATTPPASDPAPTPPASDPAPTPTASGAAPVLTVAADGSGMYKTVQAAVDAVAANNASPVTISIQKGTYRENVVIPATKAFISLVGAGSSPADVVLVSDKSAGAAGTAGSATLYVQGHDFSASNVTISNDYDEAANGQSQALALYLNADRQVLDNVRLLGDQDTFLNNDKARTYVTDSYIEGTVDFIYGGGVLVCDSCKIYEKRSTGGPITAANTDIAKKYGMLFYRSTITGATDNTTQLGRPWRQDANVLYRESDLSATIATAQPWVNMGDAVWEEARFAEYKNTGAGAEVNDNRPQLSDAEAADFTPEKYLAGSDAWNPTTTDTPTDTSTDPTLAAPVWSDKSDGFASTGTPTTGGAAGETVTVTTLADLVKYATTDDTAYVIKIPGTITVTPFGYEIPVKSNKTLIGAGAAGRIKEGGFFLGTGVGNVIIRNLTIGDTAKTDDDPDDKTYDYDGIQMDTANHVWIDHNTFQNINDGYIDSRKDTTDVTVSWNRLGDHNKTFGIGWTENVTARETIHHNWIHDTNQRNPSADNLLYAHLYNNYLANVTSYGNLSRGGTKMVLENSYFDHVANPWNIDDTTKGQLKQSGSIAVNSTGKQVTGGAAFTPSDFYPYTLDEAADVPALVKMYSGPQADIGV